MINVSRISYLNYGDCVCLDNGIIRLVATLEYGPRVVFFGFTDGENIMFTDEKRIFTQDNGDWGRWTSYGGHRLWLAPEVLPETYYPDESPVEMLFSDGVLKLTAPVTPFGKQFSVAFTMSADSASVKIENRILNASSEPSRFAPWSITALTTGGTEIIPLSRENTGFLANRAIALWSYTDIKDERFHMFNDFAALRQDTQAETPFKVGFSVDRGYGAYARGGDLFIKRFGGYENVLFPDFSCNFETYTNKHFIECELVGELREYKPDESAILSEEWELHSISPETSSDLGRLADFVENTVNNSGRNAR